MFGIDAESFQSSREIAKASQIPILRCSLRNGLIGLVALNRDVSSIPSVRLHKGRYFVSRNDPFPFSELEEFLPRFAQRKIIPEVVDLIPSGSWFASLANMLVSSSWKQIRDVFLSHYAACQECGDISSLEGHEIWSYDNENLIQSLQGVRCLCSRCHSCQHLGRANIVGNFDGVFSRLCSLNRILDEEKDVFKDAIFGKYIDRSKFNWSIDVSGAFQIARSLSLKSDIFFEGDGWIVRPAKQGKPEIAVHLVNVEIASDGKRLVLVPPGSVS